MMDPFFDNSRDVTTIRSQTAMASDEEFQCQLEGKKTLPTVEQNYRPKNV